MHTFKTQRIHLYIGIAMLLIALGSFGIASAQTTGGNAVVLDDTAKIRITNLIANMANKHEALLVRYESIASRMEARIAIMEARGQNMEDSRFYLQAARDSMTNARTTMENIDTDSARMIVSQEPASVWPDIRLSLTQTRGMHEQTRKLLGETLLDIKDEELAWVNGDVQSETDVQASSTEETSAADITSETELTVQ